MKTIFISGGNQGLGRALAEKFAGEHNVVILARNEDKGRQAAEEVGCDLVVADVSDYTQIQAAVDSVIQKYGAIDCLINNAGLWIQGALEDNDPEQVSAAMNVNATATILLTRACLPYMKKAQKGRIINVISQSGFYGKGERSVYTASKWAIAGFTKSLQMELTGTAVTVCGFYPGSMKTEFFANAGVEKDSSKFMELSEVVRAVEFIVDTPDHLSIPELGIKPAYY
ncbi:SDR family oxidoreductase [Patescibacteria group bacterium]|nr:SDR family oxidoreductase [Patescibacteria group bacterium]MBU1500568.1 SDR family oxidoreductase [Patescibacteria group bacterium]MBU2080463.1 SDR family oxidoreductase [Patescibacteria group bacterium]MBU2123732.1 SDR family oxidoreductase [Patescibacteria group bacterium]MBU2194588.1 SDR family oxidoreductase [Patescibacteria group bacterium]